MENEAVVSPHSAVFSPLSSCPLEAVGDMVGNAHNVMTALHWCLCYTCATDTLSMCIPFAGAGIKAIQAALRHVSPALTTHYMPCTYSAICRPAFLLCTTLPCLISSFPNAYHVSLCMSEPPEIRPCSDYERDNL